MKKYFFCLIIILISSANAFAENINLIDNENKFDSCTVEVSVTVTVHYQSGDNTYSVTSTVAAIVNCEDAERVRNELRNNFTKKVSSL